MAEDNKPPREQSAQEAHPVSLDHDELEAIEMETISGGVRNVPCTAQNSGCMTNVHD